MRSRRVVGSAASGQPAFRSLEEPQGSEECKGVLGRRPLNRTVSSGTRVDPGGWKGLQRTPVWEDPLRANSWTIQGKIFMAVPGRKKVAAQTLTIQDASSCLYLWRAARARLDQELRNGAVVELLKSCLDDGMTSLDDQSISYRTCNYTLEWKQDKHDVAASWIPQILNTQI